jgi:hypothetical protein
MSIRDVANTWFRSYLEGRKQIVHVNTSKGLGVSDYLEENLGVQQGSILGPILYIIYVNDFFSLTLVYVKKYVMLMIRLCLSVVLYQKI